MFRIDDQSAVQTPPTFPAPTTSGPGYFSPGNPTAGVDATLLAFWWFNQIQEEFMSILAAAGITPAKGVNNQVLASLQMMFGTPLAGSIGGSGWQTLDNGLIVQWGTGDTTTGFRDPVIFPTVFPNNIFSIIATEGAANGWGNPPAPTIYGSTRAANNALNGFLISSASIISGSGPTYNGGLTYNYIALGN